MSVNGKDSNDGSTDRPLKTISAAAKLAKAGDTVTVHAGTYREWVKPLMGGTSDACRIVYRAAAGEVVTIKGSEVITGWERVEGNVWKAKVPLALFGDYNPYTDVITGDWFTDNGRDHHTGEVYLNGKALYEVPSLDQVKKPAALKDAKDAAGSLFQWYTETDETTTTLWANFHSKDPNRELVEINVRQACFFPAHTGVNYITVRGFHMCHAATQWAPPTAEQIGMVGPNWSKGWIIENNVLTDSKCSAISLGKERASGHNFGVVKRLKSGFQYQLESVFSALNLGWNRDTVGSHVVRNNTISDCEQTGVVGHLGCAFSRVENNHIFNIWTKRQFSGAEMGGIKFHAAIDVTVEGNRIHHCGLAVWMDWQAQGTRITGNLLHDNDKDVMIEVCHGPCLVDHNIMLSPMAIDMLAQGSAFVNNLIVGTIQALGVPNRATPYHVHHSTMVAGTALIGVGDDRYYNNVFIAPLDASVSKVDAGSAPAAPAEATGKADKPVGTLGLALYNAHPSSWEAYLDQVAIAAKENFVGSVASFSKVLQPVFIASNLSYNGAVPYAHEKDGRHVANFDHQAHLEQVGDQVFLSLKLDEGFAQQPTVHVTTESLGNTRISDAPFVNPDGSFLQMEKGPIGPLAELHPGLNRVKVWPR